MYAHVIPLFESLIVRRKGGASGESARSAGEREREEGCLSSQASLEASIGIAIMDSQLIDIIVVSSRRIVLEGSEVRRAS